MTRPAATHYPAPDPNIPADYRGRRYCTCGLVIDPDQPHPSHSVTEVDPEIAAAERARYAEREEQ